MKRLVFHSVFVLCVGIVLLAGCSQDGLIGPTGTVSGTVTLKGKPLGEATITFFGQNNGDTAMGVTQGDGTYTLMYGIGFSVPAGDYRVSVTTGISPNAPPVDPSEMMKSMKPGPLAKSTIPTKYQDPGTSALVAVVKEGTNPNISFDLK